VNAGLGFNGYSESGDAQWNLIDNADIVAIEVCLYTASLPVMFSIIIVRCV
jgi:hypothetical protein